MDAKGNQAAYPLHPNQNFASTVLTKRELIAAMAMQGFSANPDKQLMSRDFACIAEWAVNQADALLGALSKPALTPAQMAEGDYTSQMGS